MELTGARILNQPLSTFYLFQFGRFWQNPIRDPYLRQSAPHSNHSSSLHLVHHEPHAAWRPHLDGARHSPRRAAAAANKGTSATHSNPQVRVPRTRLAILAAPDTHSLDVCARSRVIVSNHVAKAVLRERRGTHEAARRVVLHVPSTPPELRVMMSIPTIFNPNLNGKEPILDFLPSPNETVGFKCAPRLPRPDCPMHRACPSCNDAREARAPSPHAMSPRRVPRGFVSSACRHPYELAATRSTGSSVRAPSAPSSAPCTKAPRTAPWHSSA